MVQEPPVVRVPDDKKDDIFGKTRADDAANDAPLYKPFSLRPPMDDLAQPKEIVPIHESGIGAPGLAPPFEMP